MDPNFGFNSPAIDTNSKPGLSSARLLRRKKPTLSTRSRQNSSTNDYGFNPFRKAPEPGMGHGPAPGRVDTGPFGLSSDTFGPEVSGRSGSAVSSFNLEDFTEKAEISDELRELKIGNNREKLSKKVSEFDKFQFLEMRDELKQMNIGGAVDFRTVLKRELENLNIRDDAAVDFRTVLKRELENLNIRDDAKVLSETVISDYLKGLKIKETTPSNPTAGENERGDANLNEIREEAKESRVEKGSGKSKESLHSFSSGITARDGLNGGRQEDQTTSTSSASFMSNDFPFPGNGKVFEAPLRDGVEKKVRVKPDYGGIENLRFEALNLEGGLNGMTEQKRETANGSRYWKRKGKVRKDIPTQSSSAEGSVCVESSQQYDEFVEPYSPMDVSPYRDTLTDEVLSQQASGVLDQKIMHDYRDFSMESQPEEASSDVGEEECDLPLPRVISGVEVLRHTKEAEPSYSYGKDVNAQGSSDESVSDAETESFKSATDQFEYSLDSFATADASASDTEVTSSSVAKGYDDGVGDFNFDSSWAENGDSGFRVAPSASGQSQSLEKPSSRSKKKNQVNVTCDFSNYTPSDKVPFAVSPLDRLPVSVTRTQLSPEQGVKSDASSPLNQWKMKPDYISCHAASNAAQELCEKWRLRGNQAYAIGNLSEAENFYTEGVNTISESETSRSCLRALALCYSNRAATRISLGRIKEALEDCMKAISIDPNFPRVHIRAANCYLALGEIENALLHFERGSHAGPGIPVEKKLLAEASEGLQKAKKASEIFKLSAELLHGRKHADAERALLLIDEALMLSPCSEKLLERKADALLMMQKYEDVIQFCGQNPIASNSESSGSDDQQRASLAISQRSMHLIAKAYFFLGRLEDALDILKKQELPLVSDKCGSMMMESFTSLAGTISELLRLKDAGNRAFQSGKHEEAVQHYTAAISWNVLSRPFTAICYCNRAAAYQAMGQITDALADCSLAIALDPNYLKPYSRRAALFEKIKDYRQAALDLQRLLSLLKKKLEDTSSDRMSYVNELKQVDLKLSLMEEAARHEVALDLYLILGVDRSAAASEIKKAYRRAALKFHPDKAGQSLARNEGADDTIWREISSRVYTDADRLFKMIGEAYAILSEPSKRAQYDMGEEIRNEYANRGNGNSIYRKEEDFKRYPYGRSKWEKGRPFGRYRTWG